MRNKTYQLSHMYPWHLKRHSGLVLFIFFYSCGLVFLFCQNDMRSCLCAVLTCWTRIMYCLFAVVICEIEKTRWVSFDIKFTRQGFENACWHREACRAIQQAFSKPSLVNLISKDANLVFYLSVYPVLKTLRTSDYDVISDVCVDSASLATSFKKCNVIMTW